MIVSTNDAKRILAAARGKGMLNTAEMDAIAEKLALADAQQRREHYRMRCCKCDSTPCTCGVKLYY